MAVAVRLKNTSRTSISMIQPEGGADRGAEPFIQRLHRKKV